MSPASEFYVGADETSNKMRNIWKKRQFIILVFNEQEKTETVFRERTKEER
jgi:hypothetical protein